MRQPQELCPCQPPRKSQRDAQAHVPHACRHIQAHQHPHEQAARRQRAWRGCSRERCKSQPGQAPRKSQPGPPATPAQARTRLQAQQRRPGRSGRQPACAVKQSPKPCPLRTEEAPRAAQPSFQQPQRAARGPAFARASTAGPVMSPAGVAGVAAADAFTSWPGEAVRAAWADAPAAIHARARLSTSSGVVRAHRKAASARGEAGSTEPRQSQPGRAVRATQPDPPGTATRARTSLHAHMHHPSKGEIRQRARRGSSTSRAQHKSRGAARGAG